MPTLTAEIREEIKNFVYSYIADEFEISQNDLNGDTHLINDLGGDSLMFIQMLELLKKKHNLQIDLQTIGKHLMKNPVSTLDSVVVLITDLYQYENDIINKDMMN